MSTIAYNDLDVVHDYDTLMSLLRCRVPVKCSTVLKVPGKALQIQFNQAYVNIALMNV